MVWGIKEGGLLLFGASKKLYSKCFGTEEGGHEVFGLPRKVDSMVLKH